MTLRYDWVTVDARHDAKQELLLAEWRGEQIKKPAHWENRVALRLRIRYRRQRRQEIEALGKFVDGEMTDLFGRPDPLHGEAYREKIRQQARARAAKLRAKGIVRHGRDG